MRLKHRIAVLAYDGVVLGDLATPLEIFGRVRDPQGRACYDVRVCGVSAEVESEYLRLAIPWMLSWAARAETVIVPGIDNLERIIPPAISRVLRSASDRGARTRRGYNLFPTRAPVKVRISIDQLTGLAILLCREDRVRQKRHSQGWQISRARRKNDVLCY